MDELDLQIERERKTRLLRLLAIGSIAGIALLVYGLWLFLARGYVVNIEPEEALENHQLSLEQGSGFFVGNALYIFSAKASIQASSPGFISETLAIDAQTPSQITITLKPKPAVLLGKVTSSLGDTLKDTQWLIDANPIHTGASIEHQLAPGEYTLSISHPQHRPLEEKLSLGRDEQFEKTWQLEVARAELSITTTPENAEISINGQTQGQTPFSQELTVGEYAIEISKQGFQTQRDTIKISNTDREIERSYNLVPVVVKKPRPPKPAAAKLPEKPFSVRDLGIQMLRVKPSAFTMGSPPNEKGRLRNEFPLPVDFTRAIAVSRHEITEAQYAAFSPTVNPSNLPVTNISWLDAVRYTNWLSQKEKRTPFYQIQNGRVVGVNKNAKGYRLLSEAEWEWLAKRGKRASSTVFVWGNSERIPKNSGNFADQSLGGSRTFSFKDYSDGFRTKAPVGSFKVDRLGLYDMAGNVSEWVHDRYTNTPPNTQQTAVDYLGANRGLGHVVKGGNYHTGRLSELRSAYRQISQQASPTIGFRIARYE